MDYRIPNILPIIHNYNGVSHELLKLLRGTTGPKIMYLIYEECVLYEGVYGYWATVT